MGPTGGDDDRLGNGDGLCSCVGDPFSALPPELRHRPQNKGSLRHVECPSCGKEYWTNRETDLCINCEKVSARSHRPQESRRL